MFYVLDYGVFLSNFVILCVNLTLLFQLTLILVLSVLLFPQVINEPQLRLFSRHLLLLSSLRLLISIDIVFFTLHASIEYGLKTIDLFLQKLCFWTFLLTFIACLIDAVFLLLALPLSVFP